MAVVVVKNKWNKTDKVVQRVAVEVVINKWNKLNKVVV
jgi:hypothetical protein